MSKWKKNHITKKKRRGKDNNKKLISPLDSKLLLKNKIKGLKKEKKERGKDNKLVRMKSLLKKRLRRNNTNNIRERTKRIFRKKIIKLNKGKIKISKATINL